MKMSLGSLLNKKILIFGAGNVGKAAICYAGHCKAEIIAVVDNNKTMDGKTLLGCPIVWAGRLKNEKLEFDYIILGSVQYSNEMKSQLLSMGIDNKKIIDFEALREIVINKEYDYYSSLIEKKNNTSISVLYDGQIFSTQRMGGISRYFYEIIEGISRKDYFDIDFFGGVVISDFDLIEMTTKAKKSLFWDAENALKDDTVRFELNKRLTNNYQGKGKHSIYHPTYLIVLENHQTLSSHPNY